MQRPVLSTIAQVLFEPSSTFNFARVVSELEQVLSRLKPEMLSTSWDCDDLVFFDMAETRIALGFNEFPHAPIASCLTVSVGAPCLDALPAEDPGFDVLCSRIVERLQTRYVPLAVLWNQTSEEITSDLIDKLTDGLPSLDSILPPIEKLIDPLWQTATAAEAASGVSRLIRPAEAAPARPLRPAPIAATLAPVATPAAPVETRLDMPPVFARQPAVAARPHLRKVGLAANDMQPAVLPTVAELGKLRTALYPAESVAVEAEGERLSTQMRLAVHCMNATLIMVWMPLGAAVMTYSILKGEDMRFSGRIMALTGTFLAFAHSPLAHSVAAAVAGT